MNKQSLIVLLILYAISTGGSFFAFRALASNGSTTLGGLVNPSDIIKTQVPEADKSNRIQVAAEEPRTEACPLNGVLYTKAEKESWEKRRPLAVMIENHTEARPQSGLSKADVVYEAVVEGGITRFMGMFYCGVQAKDTTLAPIRSARQAFIDWASEYNYPLYVHVGGANGADTDPKVRALEHISDYGWSLRNDLNQFSIGYPTFVRNYDRIAGKDLATEHTMETSTERLWAVGEKRGFTNVSPDTKIKGKTVPGEDWRKTFALWKFKDDAAQGDRGSVQSISHEFWTGYKDFAVQWSYDSATNSYKRTMGGESHTDLNDGKQITAKTVIVMEVKEKPRVDVHMHNYLETISSLPGKAYIFMDGKKIEGTWTKKSREDRIVFLDNKGKQMEFNRGLIWISAIDKGVPVTTN